MTPQEPYPAVCQPIEAALRQQVEQERLLNQVTTQIRQSLELPVILETAVQQVRNFLAADRLVIYQFKRSMPLRDMGHKETLELSEALNPAMAAWPGCVIHEALAHDGIQSVLGWGEPDYCFSNAKQGHAYYHSGETFAIADVETTYADSPCFLQMMQSLQVRSKLVAPIVIQDQPWGLLIAHQCTHLRAWLENEEQFLRHIAEHLAIAIYQAELYAELQRQKKNLEQQVIERTRELRDTLLAAQSADRAKSEFLANVSHEFRSPLTTVIGMSATLLRWTFGNLSSRQRHYLQTIHDSGKHLLELINDVLDLSQLEAGKMVLKIREFSLSHLAQQVLESFQETAQQNEINLCLEISGQMIDLSSSHAGIELLFPADRRRVRQILLNLLSNALKFTPPVGRVILRVWIENHQAILQVEDTGIGIAEDQKPLLFQKFQQLDTSYHREYQGTGLGLALTKQLVELHHGQIDVETELGKGSCFTVWLPAQPLSLPDASHPVPTPATYRAAQIVLIESDEVIARSLCDTLTNAGYHVIWMMQGLGAISQIKLLQPEVVVINMQLERTDGYEIIQKLRRLPQGRQLKILAVHPQPQPGEASPSIPEDADDGLAEPINTTNFLGKVERLLKLARAEQTSMMAPPTDPES